MKIDNPYLNTKRILMVSVEKENDPHQKKILQDKLDNLLIEERKWLEEQLSELQGNINDKSEKLEELHENIKDKTKTKKELKKISIDLYRQIVGFMQDGKIVEDGLVQKARELKQMLR